MSIPPIAYVVFVLAWLVAAVLVAHVYSAFFENRRYAALVVAVAVSFVLGAAGLLSARLWNDATAASSLLHQRLFLVGFCVEAAAVSVLIGLKAYQSRFLQTAWRPSVGLMMFVSGVGVGTTEFSDARLGDVLSRFSGISIMLSLLVIVRPQAIKQPVPSREAVPPQRPNGRPRLRAVPPPVSD